MHVPPASNGHRQPGWAGQLRPPACPTAHALTLLPPLPRRLFPPRQVGEIAAHANDRKLAAKSVQARLSFLWGHAVRCPLHHGRLHAAALLSRGPSLKRSRIAGPGRPT